mgnify:CR=1 FL=1
MISIIGTFWPPDSREGKDEPKNDDVETMRMCRTADRPPEGTPAPDTERRVFVAKE